MIRFSLCMAVCLVVTTSVADAQTASVSQEGLIPGRLWVMFSQDAPLNVGPGKTGMRFFDETAARYGVVSVEKAFPMVDKAAAKRTLSESAEKLRYVYDVRYSTPHHPDEVAAALARDPYVIYAEACPYYYPEEGGLLDDPNDPVFPAQEHLGHVVLPDAWDTVKGEDGDVVIAIVDGGTDWRHEDLQANVWSNPGEVPGNSIDDDGNGYVDDVHGWNFANDSADPTGLSETPDNAVHGTAVAGVAAAVSNNGLGIAGASWNAKFMAINVGCPDRTLFCHHNRGMAYAFMAGADIINASFVTLVYSITTEMVVQAALEMGSLVVTTAGNEGINVDENPRYPASYPATLSVGATANNEDRNVYSYGRSMNVYAPGIDVTLTLPDDKYGIGDGTSFSAPLVSGIAALVKTRNPNFTPQQVREQVRITADNIDAANPEPPGSYGRGRVNALRAVTETSSPAVRIVEWDWTDDGGDGHWGRGEMITITAVFTNFLAAAQGLTLQLESDQEWVSVMTDPISLSTLASGQSHEATFKVLLLDSAPLNTTMSLYSHVTAMGSYDDTPDIIRIASTSTALLLAIDPQSVGEDVGTKNIQVTVSLNGVVRSEATAVTITVTNGTALDDDYRVVSIFRSMMIPMENPSITTTVRIEILEDDLTEEDETIVIGASATGLISASENLVITDDDASLSVTLGVSPSAVAEDVGTAPEVMVTATVDGGRTFVGAQTVTVSVGAQGDSAVGGTDYVAVDDFEIMIPAGAPSATGRFTLDPENDDIAEGSKTVSVTGSLSGRTVTPTEITITDDDASLSVTLSVSPSAVAEDVRTAPEVAVTATVNGGRTFVGEQTVTVSVGAQGDSATEGTDYAAVDDFEIMIPAGAPSATGRFTLDPEDDGITEGSETVSVTGSLSGRTVTPAMVTITDDDTSLSVTLSVSPVTVAEDVRTAPEVTVTVTATVNGGRTFVDEQTVTVSVGAQSDSAMEGADYAAVDDFEIMIPAGAPSATGRFTLNPTNDDIAEDSETVSVTGSLSGRTVTPAMVTITDDDTSLSVTLSVSPVTVAEDVRTAPEVTVTATVNGGRTFVDEQTVTVSVGAQSDSAMEGADYAAVDDFEIMIPAGAPSATGRFTLDPTNDDIAEDSETVSVTGSLSGRTVTPAMVTITDDDASLSVTLSVSPSAVAEDVGTAPEVTVTATVNGGRAFVGEQTVTVSVGAQGDSAEEGTDYAAVDDFEIMIPAGAPSATGRFTLDPEDDDIAEGSETVSVTGSLSGRTVTPAMVTITDDDASLSVTLSVSPSAVAEDVGTAPEVTVTANGGRAFVGEQTVTVSVGAQGDSATEGTDYAAVDDFEIMIPAGAPSATGRFTLDPEDDGITEGSETVSVTGSLNGRTVTPAIVTITDDDAPSTALTLTIAAPARLHEGSGTSWVRFSAGLGGAVRAMDTPVDVGVTDGTATADADYSVLMVPPSLMIPGGEVSSVDSLQIAIIDDDMMEGDETIAIELSSMGLTSSMQNLVIIDDESAVRVDTIMVDANDAGGYTITAPVRQNMGAPVTGVELYYGDGIAFEIALMEMLSEGSYTAELMAPAEGDILYYYVEATNGDGLTATYPPEGRYWDVSDYTEGSRLLFLDFEDEDAGDQSAVRHHVSYEGYEGGTPTFAEGALVLDGVDDHAEILGSSLGVSEEFALEIMFNADNVDAQALDGNEEYLVAKPVECDTCWEGSTFSLLWRDGSDGTYVAARFWNSEYEGGQVELEVPLALIARQWYHAVLQVQKEATLQRAVLQLRDGSGMLYGEDTAMLSAPPSISTYPIFMGHIGNLGFFDGRIDDVAFYNYAHFDLSSTGVEDAWDLPEGYVLEQNYPNPFNPVTAIRYDLARVGHVRLEVSDLLGRRVAVLVDRVQQAGAQEVRFDARDLPSGMYLYRLRIEDFVSVKKMVLLK